MRSSARQVQTAEKARLPDPEAREPVADSAALVSLVGAPKARLLGLLDEPLPTIELARRLGVTASAVSQHLGVLYATGLVSRARHGRQVLYRRSPLGDRLTGGADPA